jgi:hypothetical protein
MKTQTTFDNQRKQLGDCVRDRITGFAGIVTGRTEWLNGCSRVGVQCEKLKDGLPQETQWFDEPQVQLVQPRRIIPAAAPPGGPRPNPSRHPDPARAP